MRTPEQISNLRRVLSVQFGTMAYVFPDESIDAFANEIQHRVDTIKYIWEVRVRLQDNINLSWTEIEKEQTPTPYLTIKDISDMCKRLLVKCPGIVAINISNGHEPEIGYTFERET